MDKKIIIAIDGFSSCGKSTMAKDLAAALGYTYIDTGAMYRAVSLFAIENKILTDTDINEKALKKEIKKLVIDFKPNDKGTNDTFLNGENIESKIRTLEIGNGASRISTIKFVRKALVEMQQKMGENKGIVMDGRDIGSVVFPNAELKIFVTASPEIRAERRYKELQKKGDNCTFEQVLSNVKERDKRDTTRKESPLIKVKDAILLDNSNKSIEEQKKWLLQLVHNKIN